MYENLFSPFKIRGLELKNRIKFPAAAVGMHAEDGSVTDKLIDFHVARVNGGSGLNTTEATSVHAPSAPEGVLNISEDKFIPGFKKLTDAIHSAGGKACIQLQQGGLSTFYVDAAVQVFLPSDYPDFGLEGAPVELIHEVVDAFGQSASRAVKAGFDAIEFHVAHGYAPHAFLSAAVNHRTDEYGGSLANRSRFAIECIRAIRTNVPEDFPLFMRIIPFDDFSENGLTAEDIIAFCKKARDEGVDILDVSRGNLWSNAVKYEIAPIDLPRGFNVENAARLKKDTGMPVVAVGRINDPGQAEEIISSGMADLVDIGRAQICDPEFANKAQKGQEEDIIRCIACCQGCIDRCNNPDYEHVSCLRNPAVGRELEYALKITDKPKKVLVAGGGVAGMEAAITLKQRGHHPLLVESSAELGGSFLLAGLAPRKAEMRDAVISRARQTKKAGVEILTDTPLTTDLISEINPEGLVIATGAQPIIPDIPGINLPNVYGFREVLTEKVKPAGKIAVLGGGLIGLETAEFLADGQNAVTIIEMQDEIGEELGHIRGICVMEALGAAGIKTMTETKAVEVKEHSLVVERDGNREEIEIDSIVIAAGMKAKPREDILSYCESRGITVYTVGDALESRTAIEAVEEAAAAARAI